MGWKKVTLQLHGILLLILMIWNPSKHQEVWNVRFTGTFSKQNSKVSSWKKREICRDGRSQRAWRWVTFLSIRESLYRSPSLLCRCFVCWSLEFGLMSASRPQAFARHPPPHPCSTPLLRSFILQLSLSSHLYSISFYFAATSHYLSITEVTSWETNHPRDNQCIALSIPLPWKWISPKFQRNSEYAGRASRMEKCITLS